MDTPSESRLKQIFIALRLVEGRREVREEKARWRKRYPEKARQAMKVWRDRNPDKWKAIAKRSGSKARSKFTEKDRAKARLATARHRLKFGVKEKTWAQIKDRMIRDPLFAMLRSFQTRLSGVLSGKTRNATMLRLIGCTGEGLRTHIEKQFKPGMTWATRGRFGWHVDHIRPLASFKLSDPEQLKKAWHFTNFQPLWWRDNIIKGSKMLSCTTT